MKVGDKVRIVKSGVLCTIRHEIDNKLNLEDDYGFEYKVLVNDVVPVDSVPLDELLLFRNYLGINCDKNTCIKDSVVPIGKKLIIDLHANALLKNRSGMSSGDVHKFQLDTIRQTLRRESVHHGRTIVFIHGKGKGVLREELIAEVNKWADQMTFHDAPVERYGFQGALNVSVL